MKTSVKRSTVALSTLGAFLTVSQAPLMAAPPAPVQPKVVAVAAQPTELTDSEMGEVKGELIVPIIIGGVIIGYGAIWCYNQMVADYYERKGREANMGY